MKNIGSIYNKITTVKIGNKDFTSRFVLWLIFLVIFCVSYSAFFNTIETSDYMLAYASRGPRQINFWDHFSSGRIATPILEFAYNMLLKFNVDHFDNVWVVQLLGMAINAISSCIIFEMFYGFIRKESTLYSVLTIVAISTAFVNPFMVETYIYHEFDWAVGIICAVVSARFFSKKKFLLGAIFSILALTIYQTNIFITFILTVYFYCFRAVFFKEYKGFFKVGVIIPGALCTSVAIVVAIGQKVGYWYARTYTEVAVQKTKVVSFDNFRIDGIREFFHRIHVVYEHAYSMLPHNFLVYLTVIVLLIVSIALVVGFGDKYSFAIVIFTALVVILAEFSWGFTRPFFDYPPRTTLGVFFIVSMNLLLMIVVLNNIETPEIVPFILGMTPCLIIYVYTQYMIIDTYTSAGIDYTQALIIEQHIEDYEKYTGETVTTIASCGGGGTNLESTYTNPNLLLAYGYGTPNHRMVYDRWAQGYYINYVTDRNYNIRFMTDEEVDIYFPHKETEGILDMNTQFVFDGSTLFWRIY